LHRIQNQKQLMKKIYSLLFALVCSYSLFAQVPTGDMETWRSRTAGHGVAVEAPFQWYSSDSIIIGMGESLIISIALHTGDTDWHRQIFEESTPTYVHGGSHSAKIMTAYEDSFLVAGVLTNAIPSVGITLVPTPSITSINLNGGSPISAKPTSVSAWVQYYAGQDTSGATGIDSGMITVQALGHLGGKDSVIGTGIVSIAPTASWVQVTANLVYTDTTVAVDTFRIALSSSNRPFGLDSSTLYVDDITMTTTPNPDHSAVKNVTASEVVKVYPNPSNGIIYFEGARAGLVFSLYDVNGKLQTSKTIMSNDHVDVSSFADGSYLYAIRNEAGMMVQQGKVNLSR